MSVEDIQMANKKRKLDNGTTFCQKCWQIAKFCEKKTLRIFLQDKCYSLTGNFMKILSFSWH